MKKIYFLSLILFLSSPILAQKNDNTDKGLVKQLIRDIFEDIWSDFNKDKVLQYHTVDFLLLEQGEVWSIDSILAYQTKKIELNAPVTRHNKIEFIETKQKSDNLIWVAYDNYAYWTRNSDQKVIRRSQYLESAIAVKTKDGWKLQMLHSTRTKNELIK